MASGGRFTKGVGTKLKSGNESHNEGMYTTQHCVHEKETQTTIEDIEHVMDSVDVSNDDEEPVDGQQSFHSYVHQKQPLAVIAIDFGTTCTGYEISLQGPGYGITLRTFGQMLEQTRRYY